jgi:hypothetical protein
MEEVSLCSLRSDRLRFLQSIRCRTRLAFLLFTPILICCSFAQAQGESGKEGSDENWIATWGCAPGFAIGQEISNQTIRQFARISVGGKCVRIRLSNETGTQPIDAGRID